MTLRPKLLQKRDAFPYEKKIEEPEPTEAAPEPVVEEVVEKPVPAKKAKKKKKK